MMRFPKFMPILFIFLCSCAINAPDGDEAFAQTGSISEIFQEVNPAVVKLISVEKSTSTGAVNPKAMISSGVVVSENGLILTAAHAVNIADRIAVTFLNGDVIRASVVALSTEADIALLSLESVPDDLYVARLGDSDKARVGNQVLVIGAPYGIDHTLSVGHISGRRQSRTMCQQLTPFEFLQTDAAINIGNSGGPMFDTRGRVIGIVSRILSQSGGSVGLGFAVSINTARKLLMEQKSFWIGFNVYMLSGPMAKAFNLPQDAGLLVQHVAENSPGYEMGLRGGTIPIQSGEDKFLIGGDIILAIQGFPVTPKVGDVCTIQDMVGGFTQDTAIEITVLRNGKKKTLRSRP